MKVSYNPNGTIALELHIAVDQGVNLPVLCGDIINEVRYKIETAAGVKVDNIDVFVRLNYCRVTGGYGFDGDNYGFNVCRNGGKCRRGY